MVLAVIPSRFDSSRFPGKALVLIAGVPLITRVARQVLESTVFDRVLVATDDERIAAAVHDPRRPGRAIAVMTDPGLPSGTDRVAAVAVARGWSADTLVVNVQGDEPFLPPALIGQAAGLLGRDPAAQIATLATPIGSLEEFMDPNVVKVVTAQDGAALYFSRAPIPWSRDGAAAGLESQREFAGTMRHVGLYAYRADALRRITSLPPSALEQQEKLEQLRALEHGMRIVVGTCTERPAPGVDTVADLERARQRAALTS